MAVPSFAPPQIVILVEFPVNNFSNLIVPLSLLLLLSEIIIVIIFNIIIVSFVTTITIITIIIVDYYSGPGL